MVEPTNGDINPSASQPPSASESTINLSSIATQAASKALSGSSESTQLDETSVFDSSNFHLPPIFKSVTESVTALLETAMSMAEETSRLEVLPRTKEMAPYELKSWVENILTIIKQSQSLVDISLESLRQLKETIDLQSPKDKPLFIGSIMDFFKSSKKE